MFCPSMLNEAHGPMISARHNALKLSVKRSSVPLSKVLAAGSKDTVTLVSEVDTRSTESP